MKESLTPFCSRATEGRLAFLASQAVLRTWSLLWSQHRGHPDWAIGPQRLDILEGLSQHLAIEKQQSVECLVWVDAATFPFTAKSVRKRSTFGSEGVSSSRDFIP